MRGRLSDGNTCLLRRPNRVYAGACGSVVCKRDGVCRYSIAKEKAMFGQVEDSGFFGWIVAGVASVFTALTTALAAVFKISETKSAKAIETLEVRLALYEKRLEESDRKHEECLNDRSNLRESVARLEGKLAAYIKDHEHDGN